MSGVFQFSQTASSNATSDPTQNWAEGMPPSAINDSARALLASIAKYRDDISGAIITTGSPAAYAVTSYQGFDTLAHFHNQVIGFTPHATNAAGPVTMTVDGFANLPLRSAPSKELLAGTLVQGTPYVAVYNNTDGALYLQGFYGSPYLIPLGASIEYWGGTAPNSQLALMYGQAISRTTYSALFALLGTTHGAGDGTTTFNIPDLRGRVVAGKDDMGGTAASRLTSGYFGTSAAVLGATGGSENHTLTTAQLASHTHANTLTDPGHNHGGIPYQEGDGLNPTVGTTSGNVNHTLGNSKTFPNGTSGVTLANAAAGSGNAHNNTQPTIIGNKLLRII